MASLRALLWALPLALFAILLSTRLAHAQDCPPDAVGCHRADIDFHQLDRRLPSVSLDSGWVPASSPIQVRFALAFMGETEVSLGGTLATYWPFGLSMATPGRPGEGHLRMAWGLEIVARMRFSATIAGTRYEWEGDIPFVPFHDLRLVDQADFDPFVLPGARQRPVSIHDVTDPVNVFSVGLSSIIGTSIPGIDGGFALAATGELTTSYESERVLIEDARDPIEREGAVVQYWPPAGGFGASEDVTVRTEGTIAYEGGVILRPNVYVTLLGRRFELLGIDVPVTLVRTSMATDFEPARVHVPLPDVVVSPTNLDGGALYVGDTADAPLRIENRGEATLNVTVDPLPDTLMVSSTSLTIPPSSERSLLVTIAPASAGVLEETLTLRTNDPDQPIVRVPVTAEGLVPDAGPEPRDAALADAGASGDASSASDAAPNGGLAGGACGCAVIGSGATRGALSAAFGLLGLLALLSSRRRRARRA